MLTRSTSSTHATNKMVSTSLWMYPDWFWGFFKDLYESLSQHSRPQRSRHFAERKKLNPRRFKSPADLNAVLPFLVLLLLRLRLEAEPWKNKENNDSGSVQIHLKGSVRAIVFVGMFTVGSPFSLRLDKPRTPITADNTTVTPPSVTNDRLSSLPKATGAWSAGFRATGAVRERRPSQVTANLSHGLRLNLTDSSLVPVKHNKASLLIERPVC